MVFAEEGCKWSSVCASASDMPPGWCDRDGDTVRVKDTGRGKYNNRLLSSTTFRYELPSWTPVGSLAADVKWLLMEDASRPVADRATVRLYRVAHGHDHDFGLWKVDEATHGAQPAVVLRRLAKQPSTTSVLGKRSRSEARHEDALRALFEPLGFRIEFEPECASGLRTPCVVDGQMSAWTSDFYTIDYVAYDIERCRNIFIESKCCAADLDEVARKKCRRLRDAGLRRVLAIVGHGEEQMIYDFGAGDADETWLRPREVASAFRAQ